MNPVKNINLFKKISTLIWFLKKYNLLNLLIFSLKKNIHSYSGRYGIISAGGVATTNLMHYVGKYRKINRHDNFDNFKHLNYIPKNKKVLYLYHLNFDLVIESLRRRHFYYVNAANLGATLSILFFFNHKISNFFFKKKLKKQILLHLNSENSLCLEYENIWSEKEKIMNFFKIKNKKKFIKYFFKKRKRNL